MINVFAILTIVKLRVREFLTEYHYSILGPIISNLLFVVIFSTIDRFYVLSDGNISFIQFLIPGLIVMVVAQESFNNPSASIINSKQIGSFDDLLLAPISRFEIFIAYILSQIIIGLLLAIINLFILSYFVSFIYFSIFSFFYYLTLVVIFFSSIGSVVGFLAYRWDTQSTISNFFISPITFMSGTFFSINSIPDTLKVFLIYNPYYYIITYFRDSFYSQSQIQYFNNIVVFVFVLIIFGISSYVFYRGYNVIK